MAPRNTRIAIIGGGIGGLTAAISLLRAGYDVQVYEQSRLLSEVGAGINISPNASRILIRLGLGEDGTCSAVGRALLGAERPRFACRAYRGLIPVERVRDIPPESTSFLGPGRHFIHYFVSAGRMLNFVGHVEQEDWISESWTHPGKVSDLRAAYAGWHPQVQKVIDA